MSTNRTTRGLVAGVLVALAVVAMPVSAQEVDPRLERIRAELPEAATEQIEAHIAAARSAGLPVEPLLDKAVEGIAKRVPPQRIAGAVDGLARDLGRAHAILVDGVPPMATDVAAAADAMRRGVPAEAIQRIAEHAGEGEPLALEVHTLGDLMDRGVPVGQALAVVEAWRGRGARAQELRELPGAIDRLIRQGVMPGPAAAAVANAMRGGPPGAGQGPGGSQGPPGLTEGGPPIPPGAGPPSDRGQGSGQGSEHGGGPPGG